MPVTIIGKPAAPVAPIPVEPPKVAVAYKVPKGKKAVVADAAAKEAGDMQKMEDAILRAEIDQLGELKAKIDAFNATTVAKFAEVKATVVKKIAAGLTAAQSEKVTGKAYEVSIGAMANVREIIDLPKAIELMTVDVFLKVASLPLKAVDDYLNPEEKKLVLSEERKGNRSFNITKIGK